MRWIRLGEGLFTARGCATVLNAFARESSVMYIETQTPSHALETGNTRCIALGCRLLSALIARHIANKATSHEDPELACIDILSFSFLNPGGAVTALRYCTLVNLGHFFSGRPGVAVI